MIYYYKKIVAEVVGSNPTSSVFINLVIYCIVEFALNTVSPVQAANLLHRSDLQDRQQVVTFTKRNIHNN
jgi:uncharacterized membrane protein YraQ (UPF0718 family)